MLSRVRVQGVKDEVLPSTITPVSSATDLGGDGGCEVLEIGARLAVKRRPQYLLATSVKQESPFRHHPYTVRPRGPAGQADSPGARPRGNRLLPQRDLPNQLGEQNPSVAKSDMRMVLLRNPLKAP